MSKIQLFTIGVYGSTADSFFGKLRENNIDTFCDIRRRRGVRGSEYSYVNSKRLQDKLSELNINYLHILDLSPTDEIRHIQNAYDKEEHTSQRKRESLSDGFKAVYEKEILSKFDFEDLIGRLELLNSRRVVLFCVEKNPAACHRSLAAEHLSRRYGMRVKNL